MRKARLSRGRGYHEAADRSADFLAAQLDMDQKLVHMQIIGVGSD